MERQIGFSEIKNELLDIIDTIIPVIEDHDGGNKMLQQMGINMSPHAQRDGVNVFQVGIQSSEISRAIPMLTRLIRKVECLEYSESFKKPLQIKSEVLEVKALEDTHVEDPISATIKNFFKRKRTWSDIEHELKRRYLAYCFDKLGSVTKVSQHLGWTREYTGVIKKKLLPRG